MGEFRGHRRGSSRDTIRNSKAINLAEETLGLSKSRLGTDHDFSFYCMTSLANSDRDADRPREARSLPEE